MMPAIGAALRAGLAEIGAPYTAEDVRQSLHETAKEIGIGVAESFWLTITDYPNIDNAAFNRALDGALSLLDATFTEAFAEFDLRDTGDTEKAIALLERAFLQRLYTLTLTSDTEGRA